jgi:DNA-binding SARP family transcriptional activator/predicted negative regulator of RcsB-dependent stress response
MLRIRLLGSPTMEMNGEAMRLEGRKTWALLTYVLLESGPPTRRELVDRLWSDADDPLGAARWALSQVRKSLAGAATIVEREGRLAFEAGGPIAVDARELLAGTWRPSEVADLVRGELLESWEFDEAPEFARWLGIQRARLAGAATDAVRTAASVLTRSDPEGALALAERGLLKDPFDDSLHGLIVETHALRGDVLRARSYLEDVTRRYRSELGIDPPIALTRLLERRHAPGPQAAAQRAAQLDALLQAAFSRGQGGDFAGAAEMANRAARDAASDGHEALEMRALIEATNYMSWALSGEPREWLAALQRANNIAVTLKDRRALSDIERERGRIAFLQGSIGAAEAALRRSLALAHEIDDRHLVALAQMFIGVCETDRCDYVSAEADLREAIENHRKPAVPMAWLARLLVKMSRYDEASDIAERSIDIMTTGTFVVQLALALIQSGDARLARGDDAGAAERFARAFTVAQEIGDHDWMALSLRGLARLDLREARPERARQTMREALSHATGPARYRWVEATILADLAEMEHGEDPGLIERGLRISEDGPMPDLADRFRRLRRLHTPVHTVAP